MDARNHDKWVLTFVQHVAMQPRIEPASVVSAAMIAKMAMTQSSATIVFKVSHESTMKDGIGWFL